MNPIERSAAERKLTKWTQTGLRTALRDLHEYDVIYIEAEDTEPLYEYLCQHGVQFLTVDRGDYIAVSLTYTTGKSARRA